MNRQSFSIEKQVTKVADEAHNTVQIPCEQKVVNSLCLNTMPSFYIDFLVSSICYT